MQKLTLLLILAVLGVAVIATGKLKTTTNAASEHIISPQDANDKDESETFIDGSKHPDKISDHTAYLMLFRLIAGRETEQEKASIRSYLRMALGCANCNGRGKPKGEAVAADIDALIATAEEFDSRVGALDRQATKIQDGYHPNHPPVSYEDREYLNRLQEQKEFVADEIIHSLPQRLSAAGMASLRRHVKERMKRRIKIAKDQKSA